MDRLRQRAEMSRITAPFDRLQDIKSYCWGCWQKVNSGGQHAALVQDEAGKLATHHQHPNLWTTRAPLLRLRNTKTLSLFSAPSVCLIWAVSSTQDVAGMGYSFVLCFCFFTGYHSDLDKACKGPQTGLATVVNWDVFSLTLFLMEDVLVWISDTYIILQQYFMRTDWAPQFYFLFWVGRVTLFVWQYRSLIFESKLSPIRKKKSWIMRSYGRNREMKRRGMSDCNMKCNMSQIR